MLNDPDVILTINEETHPVWFVYTETGFPDIPVLRSCKPGMELPWIRTNCAQWLLTDARGERLYAWSAARAFYEHGKEGYSSDFLLEGLRRHQRIQQAHSLDERTEIENELAHVQEISTLFMREPRNYTAHVICDVLPFEWFDYVNMIRPPLADAHDPVVPGVRNAAIHAIGELLIDDTPLSPLAAEKVSGRFAFWCGLRGIDSEEAARSCRPEGGLHAGIPYLIRRRAAEALEILTASNWRNQPGDIVEIALHWYAENRHDSRFRIEYSSDPQLRYAMLREGLPATQQD